MRLKNIMSRNREKISITVEVEMYPFCKDFDEDTFTTSTPRTKIQPLDHVMVLLRPLQQKLLRTSGWGSPG